MGRTHYYQVATTWVGNTGRGTADYRAYARDFEHRAAGKAALAGSADPAFRGAPARWNPEELLVASASSCHMLWYLHLCADAGIVVTAYEDTASGVMDETAGGGSLTEIVLRPQVRIADGSRAAEAAQLHAEAHHKCFVANTLRCPIRIEPTTVGDES